MAPRSTLNGFVHLMQVSLSIVGMLFFKHRDILKSTPWHPPHRIDTVCLPSKSAGEGKTIVAPFFMDLFPSCINRYTAPIV